MLIGLFGGTFDPVHLGHLILAEHCLQICELDELWFLPAGQPPHKSASVILAPDLRIDMLRYATAGHEGFRIETLELDRPELSYTVDSITALQKKYPEHRFAFLIGGDSLQDLPSWHEPERLCQLCEIIAVNRLGVTHADLTGQLERLPESLSSRIRTVTVPGIGISSSEIRQRIADGQSIRYLVPRAVEIYITENGLYRGDQLDGDPNGTGGPD